MNHKKLIIIPAVLGLILISGCAGVISDNIRGQVNEAATLKTIRDDPTSHTGEMVLWSGEIIGVKNEKAGTLIEIIQKPSDYQDRPKQVDTSEGRFIALYSGYLDGAIYKKGRELTVAGRLKGQRVLPLDDIEYTYPVVLIEEIHLWPERKQTPYPQYYHDPFWWPRPYWRYW